MAEDKIIDGIIIAFVVLCLLVLGFLFFTNFFTLQTKPDSTPQTEPTAQISNPPKAIPAQELTFEETANLEKSCLSLCTAATDKTGILNFCTTTLNITQLYSPETEIKVKGYSSCKSKIPCFIAIDCPTLTPQTCKDILLSDQKDIEKYILVITDIGTSDATLDGGCGMPDEGQGSAPNWKTEFGFTLYAIPYLT